MGRIEATLCGGFPKVGDRFVVDGPPENYDFTFLDTQIERDVVIDLLRRIKQRDQCGDNDRCGSMIGKLEEVLGGTGRNRLTMVMGRNNCEGVMGCVSGVWEEGVFRIDFGVIMDGRSSFSYSELWRMAFGELEEKIIESGGRFMLLETSSTEFGQFLEELEWGRATEDPNGYYRVLANKGR